METEKQMERRIQREMDMEELKEKLHPTLALMLSAVIVTLTVKATLWLLEQVVAHVPKL